MNSISTLNNNAYYQLSNPSAGTGGGIAGSGDALLQALESAAGGQAPSPSSDAYLLDLSPAAQQYLNGSTAAGAVSPLAPSSSGSFVLSAQQQQTIANVLEKYTDASYSQATFDQIQNDLQAAGLDPTTLSRLDQAQSFNATALFIDDLNGNTGAAGAMVSPDESQKSANYMQQIISEWQSMIGNAAPGPPASAAA